MLSSCARNRPHNGHSGKCYNFKSRLVAKCADKQGYMDTINGSLIMRAAATNRELKHFSSENMHQNMCV